MKSLSIFLLIGSAIAGSAAPLTAQQRCDPAYGGVCIPPPPPDLDCREISERNFRVYRPGDIDAPSGLRVFDPHRFDGDYDGIGCELHAR